MKFCSVVSARQRGRQGMTEILAFSEDDALWLHFEKESVGALHSHPHEQISYVVSGAFEFDIKGVEDCRRQRTRNLTWFMVRSAWKGSSGFLQSDAGGFPQGTGFVITLVPCYQARHQGNYLAS